MYLGYIHYPITPLPSPFSLFFPLSPPKSPPFVVNNKLLINLGGKKRTNFLFQLLCVRRIWVPLCWVLFVTYRSSDRATLCSVMPPLCLPMWSSHTWIVYFFKARKGQLSLQCTLTESYAAQLQE
jgi:hypothetical protein